MHGHVATIKDHIVQLLHLHLHVTEVPEIAPLAHVFSCHTTFKTNNPWNEPLYHWCVVSLLCCCKCMSIISGQRCVHTDVGYVSIKACNVKCSLLNSRGIKNLMCYLNSLRLIIHSYILFGSFCMDDTHFYSTVCWCHQNNMQIKCTSKPAVSLYLTINILSYERVKRQC